MKSERFYITTTLPYVNADPHIGFALEIVQADVLARHQRQKGNDVVFNTGTDEHGIKIYRKAQEEGIDAQAYVDRYAAKFHALKEALNLSYTNFIRTTDADHKKAAQEFWRRCKENGDIYKKQYQVKYCIGCELEKTDSELESGHCQIHPNLELELIDEENYFFRFSKYQQALLDLYEQRPDFVVPDFRLTEIRNFVAGGLEDFSVSRLKEKMPWGVPVPDDEEHVMYVWFDALVNYISTLGWPDQQENFEAFWPGVQVAGKDNLRQQSAMWQAMLFSAGLPASKQIFIHGFITKDGQKISKSLGNTVDPLALVEQYGADAVRYFLLREIPFGADGDFSDQRFRERYTADLANDLGNLASRLSNMVEKYLAGNIVVQELAETAIIKQEVYSYTEQFRFDKALGRIWEVVNEGNRLIDAEKPWELAKSDPERLQTVLGKLVAQIRLVAYLLNPYLPATADQLEQAFNADTIKKLQPLFPRLEE